MTQEEEVLRVMSELGYVNRKIAINELGIWNLTALISSMRQKGHMIINEWHTGKNRYGRKVRWCDYKMGWWNESQNNISE